MRSLLAFLVGFGLGAAVAWHAGFEAGVFQEMVMARELGECYCAVNCCACGR